MLATVFWDGGPSGAGTDWHNRENWAGDELPTAADDAHIAQEFAGRSVVVSQDVSIQSLLSYANVDLLAGTFDVASSSTIYGALSQYGGAWSGSGNVFLTGGWHWEGGSMEGTGQTSLSGRDALLAGDAGKYLSRQVTINSAVRLVYTGSNLYFGGVPGLNGSISNWSGELVLAGGDIDVLHPGFHSIFSLGPIFVSGSSPRLAVNLFQELNPLHVESGTTLTLTPSETSSLGNVNVEGVLVVADGLVQIASPTTGPGTIVVETSGVLAAGAEFQVSKLVVRGQVDVTNRVTVTDELRWESGTFISSPEAGGVTIAESARGWIETYGTKFLSSTLVNRGIVEYSDGGLYFGGTPTEPGKIVNENDFLVRGWADIFTFYPHPEHLIHNAGRLQIGTGSSTIGVPLSSTGQLSLGDEAVVRLSGGATISGDVVSSGTVVIGSHVQLAPISDLTWLSGTLEIDVGGTLEVVATQGAPGGSVLHGNLVQNGGSLRGDGDLAVSTSWQWNSGVVEGTGLLSILNSGQIGGTDSKLLSRTIENHRQLTYDGSSLYFGATDTEAGVIRNFGDMDVVGESDVYFFYPHSGHQIDNLGRLTHRGVGTSEFHVPLYNRSSATVTIDDVAGWIAVYAAMHHEGHLQNEGALQVVGTLETLPGATISGAGNLQGTGLFSIQGDVTIPRLWLVGGTVDGSGDLTVGEEWLWLGGTLAGAGRLIVPDGGTGSIFGPDTKLLSRTIENDGSLYYRGSSLYFGANPSEAGVIHNRRHANIQGSIFTFHAHPDHLLRNDASLWVASDLVPTVPTEVHVPLVSSGAIGLATGSVLRGLGTGRVSGDVTGNGTFEIASSFVFDPNPGATISNLALVAGGVVDAATSFDVGSLAQHGGVLTGAGSLNVLNDWNWLGGVMEGSGSLSVNGTGHISGADTKLLGRTVENFGQLAYDEARSTSARTRRKPVSSGTTVTSIFTGTVTFAFSTGIGSTRSKTSAGLHTAAQEHLSST